MAVARGRCRRGARPPTEATTPVSIVQKATVPDDEPLAVVAQGAAHRRREDRGERGADALERRRAERADCGCRHDCAADAEHPESTPVPKPATSVTMRATAPTTALLGRRRKLRLLRCRSAKPPAPCGNYSGARVHDPLTSICCMPTDVRLRGVLRTSHHAVRRRRSVAFDAIERLCHEYLEAGATGIVALGTTGESTALDADEKHAVIDACARVCEERARS